ncbi:MAG: DUF4974 domain-containing protein [Ignavibacterium sp.]
MKKEIQNNKLIELLNDKSFIRWMKGKASPIEESYWLEWLTQNPENQEIFDLAKQIFSISIKKEKIPDIEFELQQLKYQLVKEKMHENSSLIDKFIFIINRHKFAYLFSVIFLSLMVIIFFSVRQTNETNIAEKIVSFSTNYGEKDTIKFKDGSQIILNGNTSLSYNANEDMNKEFTVWLQGEGYFSIIPKPNGHKRIFNVNTSVGKIQVLGTKFNVESRNKITEVVLQEGKLKVLLNDTINQTSKYYIMKPGELTTLNYEKKSIKVEKVDPTFYISWINDKIIFNRTPLTAIIKKIENTYGVKIEIKNNELVNQKLSGAINNYDLKTLMNGLSIALDATIKYKEGTIIISKN